MGLILIVVKQVSIFLITNYTILLNLKNFLKQKQLDITAIYTPAHTAIRLFKKIKDLSCYCNVDKCMELLSQPLIYSTQVSLNPRHFGFLF